MRSGAVTAAALARDFDKQTAGGGGDRVARLAGGRCPHHAEAFLEADAGVLFVRKHPGQNEQHLIDHRQRRSGQAHMGPRRRMVGAGKHSQFGRGAGGPSKELHALIIEATQGIAPV